MSEDQGPFYGPIIARLKPIRLAAGLKLEDMAQACGWHGKQGHTTASRVERGLMPTKSDKIERWIEACGCDVFIVPRSGAPAPEDQRALLGVLPPSQQDQLLRLARLLPRLEAADRSRFAADVEYLERKYGLGQSTR